MSLMTHSEILKSKHVNEMSKVKKQYTKHSKAFWCCVSFAFWLREVFLPFYVFSFIFSVLCFQIRNASQLLLDAN